MKSRYWTGGLNEITNRKVSLIKRESVSFAMSRPIRQADPNVLCNRFLLVLFLDLGSLRYKLQYVCNVDLGKTRRVNYRQPKYHHS